MSINRNSSFLFFYFWITFIMARTINIAIFFNFTKTITIVYIYYLVFYELMVILKCALLLNLYIAHDGAHHQACVYGVYGGRDVNWLIAGFASRSTAMAPQIPLAQLTPIAPTGSSTRSSSYWYHSSLFYSQ